MVHIYIVYCFIHNPEEKSGDIIDAYIDYNYAKDKYDSLVQEYFSSGDFMKHMKHCVSEGNDWVQYSDYEYSVKIGIVTKSTN